MAHVLGLDAYSKAMRTELEARALTFLFRTDQVFEKVDADLLVRGQIVADVDGEEVVDLALGPRW